MGIISLVLMACGQEDFMAKPSVVCSEPALGFTFPGVSSGFPEVQDHEDGEQQHQHDGHRGAGNDEMPVVLGALE